MRAVFLDRDGTINKPVVYRELGIIDAPVTVEQFELLPGAAEAIRAFNDMGLRVVVVSNQAGVAKGHLTEERLAEINRVMADQLQAMGARLDAVYYCPHHPEEGEPPYRKQCDCRKPKAGLLWQAARELDLDLASSYMVGDSCSDVQAGREAGCRTVFIGTLKCDLCRLMEATGTKPDSIVPDLWHAAETIRSLERANADLR